jgi:hypothetical protein
VASTELLVSRNKHPLLPLSHLDRQIPKKQQHLSALFVCRTPKGHVRYTVSPERKTACEISRIENGKKEEMGVRPERHKIKPNIRGVRGGRREEPNSHVVLRKRDLRAAMGGWVESLRGCLEDSLA